MFLPSYGFGFISRKTAEEPASTNSERAVIVCWRPSAQIGSVGCRTLPREQRRYGDKDDSYKMREAFPERYDHLAGQSLSGF
jgi:hypothetical protein